MKRTLAVLGLILASAGLLRATGGLTFDKAEYAARRARLMEKIPDGAAVFLGAAPPAGGTAFRQGHDFLYLTGVRIPNAALIVDAVRKESTLFFTMSEKEAAGEGIPVDLVKNAREVTGIERVQAYEGFAAALTSLSQRTRVLYTMFKPEELGPENSNEKFNSLQRSMTQSLWDGRLTRELQFVRQLRDKFPQVDVRDCTSRVWELRKIKSAAELEVMRRAGRIGVRAHNTLIRSTRPGVAEKGLEAVFQFVCRLGGAVDMAYSPILMSGKNHAYGHYHAYDRTLRDGEMVILDAGPDLEDYVVDISTTFPVGDAFSPRQRELYEVALAVHETCLAAYRPGLTFGQVGEKVAAMLKAKGLEKYAADFRGIIRLGGYNHMVGMATHDVAGTFAGAAEVLAPGMVFACDIQLFRLEEQIGIRIEDTIAVTETGFENLSPGCPRTVAQIEALKKTDGILQSLKKLGLD